MPKVSLRIPKGLDQLPWEVRAELWGSLQKALGMDTPKTHEHNIWARNNDELLADAEDEFYERLLRLTMYPLAQLFVALGLPYEELEKSFDLQKSKNRKRSLIELIKQIFKKGKAYLNIRKQKGKAWTKRQLQRIDSILNRQPENSNSLVSEFIARVGTLAKVRHEIDNQPEKVKKAQVKSYPKSIEEGQKKGTDCELHMDKGKVITIKIKPFTPDEAQVLKHAEAHCASKVQEVTDRHRAQIKQLVIRAMKEHWSPRELAQKLFDTFEDQNRDWRRVAVTELAMATNDAYLQGCEEGATVFVSPVPGSCKYCRDLIDGKTFRVSQKPRWDDPFTYVWPGKTNFGRKPVEYVPCAPLHPHCRHRYHRLNPFFKIVDGKPVLKTHEEVMKEIEEKLQRKGGVKR